MLSALQQRILSASLTSNSTKVEGNFTASMAVPPSNSTIGIGGEPMDLSDQLIHWNRLDALLAVQWASRWVRQNQLDTLLPEHEHLLLITALVGAFDLYWHCFVPIHSMNI